MPWSRKLTARITLNEGQTFETLRDAVEYMFDLPEPRLDMPHWQFAIEALVKAARPASNRSELRAAEARLKMALMAEGVLGLRRG
jgi:hypothetical protein